VIGSVPLEKTYRRSLFADLTIDRKNFAVHVSLSSIFTMSKSGPRVPLSRAASVEAELPNFGEQDFASGYPAAYLPYQKIADRRAARPSASARRVIWLTFFAVNTRK
jgi:hypothetical protein